MLGPRNLALIAKHLEMPTTTVRYRVKRMLSNSILFLHLNPYHTYMGLKKSVVFFEAEPGYEDLLVDCLRINDFWLYLSRSYGPYEGCAGIWTIPMEKAGVFEEFADALIDYGVARSIELNWSWDALASARPRCCAKLLASWLTISTSASSSSTPRMRSLATATSRTPASAEHGACRYARRTCSTPS